MADELLESENNCIDLMPWIEWSNLPVGFLIFATGLSFFLFSQCRKIRFNTMFVLDITNGKSCVRFDIMYVTKCPEFWELSQAVQLDLQVVVIVQLRVQIDWKDVKLVNKSLRVDLPYKVSLRLIQ